MTLTSLPIDELLPQVIATVQQFPACILEAPPGAGKTTRVPRALVEQAVVGDLEILVLQPRRLPTRLAAFRVAEELGEKVGDTVGYQVRFEDLSGPKTRLRFVTEGVLTRRLLADPQLRRVGMVVLDEFHERHLAGDLALALLKRLQKTSRPDLKLVVMSATLESDPLVSFLDNAPVLRSEGRRFDVEIEHLGNPDSRPLELQVLAGLKKIVTTQVPGDILVFLPGAAEIRKSHEACLEFAERHGFVIHHLHGDLTSEEQDRAVRPGRQRKIILSTNVAETSVTIEGVAAVLDSGLARTASHSPWTGLPTLKLAKTSQASAIQRAGRAGRTQAGYCLRLYTREDFLSRPAFELPEVSRMDLAESVLALHALGISDATTFEFFERPPMASLEAAEQLLRRLGAFDEKGHLSRIGQSLLKLPLHPRLGRLLLEAERRNIADSGALAAALLGERDIRREAKAKVGNFAASRSQSSSASDVLEMMERFREAAAFNFAGTKIHSLHLDGQAVTAVNKVLKQIQGQQATRKDEVASPAQIEQALGLALLAGFPDRVARRRKLLSSELTLWNGNSANLSETSSVREAEFLLAIDVEERGLGKKSEASVRVASAVEPEWLLELFAEEIQETDELVWNDGAARVERHTRMTFGSILLEETRQVSPPSCQASEVLVQAVMRAGPGRLWSDEEWQNWKTRISLLAEAFPEAAFPSINEKFLEAILVQMSVEKRSFEELKLENLSAWANQQLSPEQSRLLSTMLPSRYTLPSGRQVPIHYETGKPPWIESRLQDFFGMDKGPAVCAGRMPLVLHLLAPNHRAVQVTSDLTGFWSRHYPSIRKELSRKYPRHSWPENPLLALPPAPKAR